MGKEGTRTTKQIIYSFIYLRVVYISTPPVASSIGDADALLICKRRPGISLERTDENIRVMSVSQPRFELNSSLI